MSGKLFDTVHQDGQSGWIEISRTSGIANEESTGNVSGCWKQQRCCGFWQVIERGRKGRKEGRKKVRLYTHCHLIQVLRDVHVWKGLKEIMYHQKSKEIIAIYKITFPAFFSVKQKTPCYQKGSTVVEVVYW
jgi:hypothetical protein